MAIADFDAFFARHERPLYAYLCRLLPTEEVAVEIAQEAFFRAWSHYDELRGYDKPEAWLYRVATNLALSALRKRQAAPFSRVFARTASQPRQSDADGDTEPFLADALDVETQTVVRDAISRALRCLPERQRAAVLLRAVHGLSTEEIAEALDISPTNARQLLRRGRERFRKAYEEYEAYEE